MERYIGTKIIEAEVHSLPACKIGDDYLKAKPGYTVRYPNADGVLEDDARESWSPRSVFEVAYRRCDAMTFGLALDAMKLGKKVCRAGWNGNSDAVRALGRYEYVDDMPAGEFIAIDTTGLQTDNPDAPKSVVPWLPSKNDMLAEDWQIL